LFFTACLLPTGAPRFILAIVLASFGFLVCRDHKFHRQINSIKLWHIKFLFVLDSARRRS
jgi:hypothetical protein